MHNFWSGFVWAEPSIEQIGLTISVICATASPVCTARFVCSACVVLKSADVKKRVISKTQNVQNICLLSAGQHVVIGNH